MSGGERELWYFACGSNLDPERFRARVGPWRERRPARLPSWRLAFAADVASEGGGGAVIVPDPGAAVDGAVYRITESQLAVLDAEEFDPARDVGARATRRRLTVETPTGPVEAEVYLLPEVRGLRPPSAAYLGHILRGLADLGYPEAALQRARAAARSAAAGRSPASSSARDGARGTRTSGDGSTRPERDGEP